MLKAKAKTNDIRSKFFVGIFFEQVKFFSITFVLLLHMNVANGYEIK